MAKALYRGPVCCSFKKERLGVSCWSIYDRIFDTACSLLRRAVGRMARDTQTDSDGNPNVFNCERNEDGTWLNNNWANPDNQWNLDNEIVLRRRKCFLSVAVTNLRSVFRSYGRQVGHGFSSWGSPGSCSNRRTSFRLLPASLPALRIDHAR